MKLLNYRYLLSIYFCVFYSLAALAQTNKEQYDLNISLNFELAKQGDTLALTFGPQSLTERTIKKCVTTADAQGNCTFNLKVDVPYGVFTIQKFKSNPNWRNDHNKLAIDLFWEKDDDLSIIIKDSKKKDSYENLTTFHGRGAQKYTTIYKIRKELRNQYNNKDWEVPYYQNPLTDTLMSRKSTVYALLNILEENKNNISSFAYQVLKTDIFMTGYDAPISSLLNLVPAKYVLEPDQVRTKLVKQLFKVYLPIPDLSVSKEAMAASPKFLNFYGNFFYLINKLKYDDPSLATTIKDINMNCSGPIREALIIAEVNKFGIDRNSKNLTLLASNIKTAPYTQMLEDHIAVSKQNIYGYQFLDTAGKQTDLSKFKGKLLLFDFWYSGCGACISYYKQILSTIESAYKNDSRIAFISISCDKDYKKWLASIPKNLYTNTENFNLNTGGLANFHPFYQDFGIFKSPFAILVDQNGNILKFDTPDLSKDIESLRKIIEKHI